MEKPLLSICIPTYNRCRYLKNTLHSIVSQKEFQNGMVEVVISDNASTDETELMIRNYALRFENIRYFKNPENIHDQNFPLALKRGKGIYRKLYNDTLLCRRGSLRYICDLLKQYNGTEKMLSMINGKGKGFKADPILCDNFEDFVSAASIWIGWIGAFGLWESECDRITDDLSGCDIGLWQCKRAYEMVEKKGEALVVNRTLFFNQEVAKRDLSYGVYQVLHLNYLSILDSYVKKGVLSRQAYENIRINNLYRLAYFLIRGEQKRQRWNVPDGESIKVLVENEAKASGIWKEYQKYYKRGKLLFKVRTDLKVVFLKIYCLYLALQAHFIEKKEA